MVPKSFWSTKCTLSLEERTEGASLEKCCPSQHIQSVSRGESSFEQFLLTVSSILVMSESFPRRAVAMAKQTTLRL